MGEEREEATVYRTKIIQFLGRSIPIILQNDNGPCPLIAICNVLLLRNIINLNPDGTEVSLQRLLSLVAERLLDSNSNVENKDIGYVQNQQQNIADAIDLLPRLATGIDVNVRFRHIHDFEFTRECAIFDLLDIGLVHGWIIDPQDKETASVICSDSYNTLMEKLVALDASKTSGSSIAVTDEDAVDFAAATTATLGVPCPSLTRGKSFDDLPVASCYSQKRKGDKQEDEELTKALDLSKKDLSSNVLSDKVADPFCNIDNTSDAPGLTCQSSHELCNEVEDTKHADCTCTDEDEKSLNVNSLADSQNIKFEIEAPVNSKVNPENLNFEKATLLESPSDALDKNIDSLEMKVGSDKSGCQNIAIASDSSAGDVNDRHNPLPFLSGNVEGPDKSEIVVNEEISENVDVHGQFLFPHHPDSFAEARDTCAGMDVINEQKIGSAENSSYCKLVDCVGQQISSVQDIASQHHESPHAEEKREVADNTDVCSSLDGSEPIYEGEDFILGDRSSTVFENREPLYEGEMILAEQADKGSTTQENQIGSSKEPLTQKQDRSLNAEATEGILIKNFLRVNASQLTVYGLFCLQEGLKERELCVFFRNNHFNTLFKLNGELYLLATDLGYLNQSDLVWEKLNEVHGDTVFMTGDFEEFKFGEQSGTPWNQQQAAAKTADYIASMTSFSHNEDINSDLQLAIALQKQEFHEQQHQQQQQQQQQQQVQQQQHLQQHQRPTPRIITGPEPSKPSSSVSKQESKLKEKCVLM